MTPTATPVGAALVCETTGIECGVQWLEFEYCTCVRQFTFTDIP